MLRCSLLCDSLCFFLLQDELDRDYAGVIAADLLLAPVAPAWGKGFGGDGFNWLLWKQRGLVDWGSPPTIAVLCAGGLMLDVNGSELLVMMCFCLQATICIAAVALTL